LNSHEYPGLFVGSPRFGDAALAELARREGAGAAWLRAFQTQGVDAPKHVSGDFAVALTLPDGTVYAAVDRFAIRSMCYRVDNQRMQCAERADSLADGAGAIDPQAIFDYLYFHVIPSPRTVFRDVMRLPPGHVARFGEGALSVTPYWTPQFEHARSAEFAPLRQEFLALLADAVRTQIDDGRTACFLSGGTDSSTVAGMLGRVSGAPASTFSIGFDAAGYDEMEYSRIAARHFGCDHHEYYVTPEDLIRSVPEVAASYDQPFGNSSALPAYYCARMAREAGITRMLGGDGGDELFGGNTRYAKQRVFGIYDHVPGALRSLVLQPLLTGNPVAPQLPLVRKVSSYVRQASVPMPERMEGYNLIVRLGLAETLTPEFLQSVDSAAPIAHQRAVYGQCNADSLVNRMLAYDWRYTLAETDLPKVVGTTALAGMPVGFPLLDDRLVAFSMRLPAHYKVKGLKLRWFFKEALRGFLPDAIITKKKQGFGLPFGVWAHGHAALNALARESLQSLSTRGFVRPEFVQSLLDQRLAEHPGYYGEMVWILMMLEQWLRRHRPDYKVCA
jgi:asparagine synthase (glutamine-hydrolysing)